MLCCSSEPESAFQSGLRLPAPSVFAVNKDHSDVSMKSAADDGIDNMHSSLLAGMLLICLVAMFLYFVVLSIFTVML